MEICVGNLSPEISEQELKVVFEAFGRVTSTRVIRDARSGLSRGIGFVDMPFVSAAQAAIRAMNGKELKGQVLRVRDAHPSAEQRPG